MIERSRVRAPAGSAGEFSSPVSNPVLTLISVFVPPPCCRSRHLKDPGHSARGAGGRLQLNTYAPCVCGFA